MHHKHLQKPLAVYVHWPWCKAKCPYCDFNSHGIETSPLQEAAYVDALCQELHLWATKIGEKRPLSSVFFGGGTPSLMQPASVARILAACAEVADFNPATEITVECNPTSSSATLFADLKQAGVNRISVGIQGLQPEWLAFLGRAHSVSQALETLEDAQHIIGNVNADVIYGLPGQQLSAWENQLKRLCGIGLSHISAYQLTIEPNTRFFADVRRGLWQPIEGDLEADFFEATQAILTLNGYENYEISNFAKPGRACAHNIHVWRYDDYLGVGAGAHGRITLPDTTRIATTVVRQPEAYLRRLKSENAAFSSWEPVAPARALQEALFLGFRLAEGVDLKALVKTFGESAYGDAVDDAELCQLISDNFIRRDGTRLSLSNTGWPRLNSLLKRILKREPPQRAITYNSHPSVRILQQLEPQE